MKNNTMVGFKEPCPHIILHDYNVYIYNISISLNGKWPFKKVQNLQWEIIQNP